ncbi:hypothetical protein EZV62_013786 [Acer yangbiense]|uniref:Uncharacterized protein n=1 Tax=Acer yangbiense TaxID=1000413 RepID=A0A5C7HZ17_9ROSI|nr:hypothetical protein EZV62_013786 [Acer yangbiense]
MGAKRVGMSMLFSCNSTSISSPIKLKAVGIGPFRFHGVAVFTTTSISNNAKKWRSKEKALESKAKVGLVKEKRRTRSNKEYEYEYDSSSIRQSHIPVMLGEVLDVFSSSRTISSFVDCTLGAAGHSSAVIQAHPELKLCIGMDVDPLAHEKAQAQICSLLHDHPNLKPYTFVKNFKHIKSLLNEVDQNLLNSGVDGILMDLGMSSMQVNNPQRGFSVLGNGPLDMRMDPHVCQFISVSDDSGPDCVFSYLSTGHPPSSSHLILCWVTSMIACLRICKFLFHLTDWTGLFQASLKAEDILNSWPDTEVGRVLREYGEESNWRLLQNKIVQARLHGGLHSTGELVDLIQNATTRTRGGRQGWIKTATRVFQALRIAVNDELKTLENSLYACFDCLAPGGRLAVIAFHSLEDRIIIKGRNGTILTKRPITPSEEEERLNRRSRSAKLRVIQKV